MITSETQRLAAWLQTLPPPKPSSKWDAIFLVPNQEYTYEMLMGWYWRTFIHPEGELRELGPICA